MQQSARGHTFPAAALILLSTLIPLTGCTTTGGDRGKTEIKGTSWEWVETATPNGRVEVAKPDRYTVRLKRNNEAQIRYDCNHGGSIYEISGNKLSFGPLTATRIFCGEDSQGSLYMQQLVAVVSFYTRDGDLFLELTAQSGTMRFRSGGG